MRVTEKLRTDELIRNIEIHSWQMSRTYDKLSSQQEVSRPSDDPVRAGTIMRLTTHVRSLEQSREIILSAQSMLEGAVGSLDRASELVSQAHALSLQAGNATLSPADREALAAEVDQLLEVLVQTANESRDERYLFGGTRTTGRPFEVTRSPEGEIASVAYAGSDTALLFPVGRGRNIIASVTGDEAFDGCNVMNALISFRDNLLNRSGLSEEDLAVALRNDMQALDDSRTHLLNQAGELGARLAQLDLTIEQTDAAIVDAKDHLSRVRDVDMAEIAVQMQKEEMVMEALLAMSGKVMRSTLMDYLG